jgi:hypothetical protein
MLLFNLQRGKLMAKQPMAEVFGVPIDNNSEPAKRNREKRLCPFNNKVPNCTKDKAQQPFARYTKNLRAQ